MHDLVNTLKTRYPDITFISGNVCSWSPKEKIITYRYESMQPEASSWALLHEVGHANLDHRTYSSDFELVQLEVDAWQQAKLIAKTLGAVIDPEHIQDCLDTYRDWLHRRSTCPECGTISIQKDSNHYECFNCRCIWRVSTSRFCRPYRLVSRATNKKVAPHHSMRDNFHYKLK